MVRVWGLTPSALRSYLLPLDIVSDCLVGSMEYPMTITALVPSGTQGDHPGGVIELSALGEVVTLAGSALCLSTHQTRLTI